MKSKKVKVKLHATVEVEFHKYDQKNLNAKARKQLKAWLKDLISQEFSYPALLVERSKHTGEMVEDCAKMTKLKVK